LDKLFNGIPIRKQNLSEWRQGGYREWVIRNDLCRNVHELSAGAQEIEADVDAPLIAGNLATVLAAQYAKVLTDWDGEPDAKIEAKLHILRIFCRDIALLQRTMHRATVQKNEFYQKLEDDEKKEFKEMKDRALAPIMALLQEKMYAGMVGKSEGLRRIGAVLAAIDNDQPIPKFDDTSPQSRTGSRRVKPVKPVKPAASPRPGRKEAARPQNPRPPSREEAPPPPAAIQSGGSSACETPDLPPVPTAGGPSARETNDLSPVPAEKVDPSTVALARGEQNNT
jgi:hypothetical protein